MTYYATLDTVDSYHIAENAQLTEFDTMDQVREWLEDAYAEFMRDAEADGEPVTLSIEAGHFGDCWFKMHRRPSADELRHFAWPVEPEHLTVREPGTHPGGNAYWIEPNTDVFVAVIRNADK